MSAPKKRKSDVHSDVCPHDATDHPHTKKEKHWFENEPENRRSSIFKGLVKKMTSKSTLKNTNKTASLSKFESVANDTHLSITSESSITSAESSLQSIAPNIGKNAGLRTFVNRDSFTPVPPPEAETTSEDLHMPTNDGSKEESVAKMEDSISVSSHMSVDTIGSTNTMEEDSMSIGSSAFCTPSRNPLHRNGGLRMSTRSVPDWNDEEMQPALFRSLCNSAVRRVPTSKSESGSTPMRRSMRMSIQKRGINAKSMEDVPEEEALTVSSSSAIRLDAPIAEEEDEQFGGAKEFFDTHVTAPNEESFDEEGQASFSRLSTSSDARKSSGASSIGRKNSIFRKIFTGKSEGKERRMSEVLSSESHPDISSAGLPRGRRASIVSFTNDCSFGQGPVNSSVSVTSLVSNDSVQKPKMRKKAPSTSNLTQRLSSVFRRGSSSTVKEDDIGGTGTTTNRRNTLTGYSSISSGIGSIASGISDSGYSTLGSRTGHSISRTGSKREDESKRERSRRLIDRIIVSDIPAEELIRMKNEQLKKKQQKEMNDKFDTQLNESGSSSSSTHNDLLSFDVIALDLKADGSPFSSTAAAFLDDNIKSLVRDEIRANYRPDRCGTITECEPELIFVCQEPPQCMQTRAQNDSISSAPDLNPDLLRNVRLGLCKSIEEWKKMSASRDCSTMLIYPMFCQSEAEWDAKATIEAIFVMIDGMIGSVKRWRTNGKCILAGLTPNNARLLREKYEEVKLSVAATEPDCPISSVDEFDTQSISSTTTVFGTKI